MHAPTSLTPFRTTRRGALLSLSALALAASGCGGSGGDDPVPDDRAEVTLLVYMMGTNLESEDGSASGNIKEMQSVTPNPLVNVVLTTGAAEKDGWRTVQRKRVQGTRIEPLADLGQIDMGSEATLRDFVTWGMQTYPAKRTILFLWDHGGGPNHGVGSDPFTGNSLSLDKIRSALASATQAAGQKLALVGFDTCLMGCVEVAQALAPYADYLVASEELEPGSGQDWAALVRHLTTKPADTTESFGRTIVDAFVAKQTAEDPTADFTLSLTDLSRMNELSAALADVSATLGDRLNASPAEAWISLAQARSKAFIFGSTVLSPFGFELADMNLFLWNSLQLPESQLDRLLNALKQAVVHENHGPSFGGSLSGLTLYLPQRVASTAKDTTTYSSLSFLPEAQRRLVARTQSVGEDTNLLPLPKVGASTPDGAPSSPGRISAPLQALYPDLVTQDFSALQGQGGELLAIKPLSGRDGDRLLDPNFMDGWLRLETADSPAVYFSALPDGLRIAEDDPETFLVPVSLREIGESTASQGFLIVTDVAKRGELRATGFLPGNLTQGSAAAPRSMEVPGNAEIQPLWLFPGSSEKGIPQWGQASDLVPFVPLKEGDLFPRGSMSQLEPGTFPRLGVIDVRGWMVLDTPAS